MGTLGAASVNDNNHPIIVNLPERPTIVGVHNGVLRDHWRVWNEHTELRNAKQGTVDSQLIFQMLSRYGEEGLRELSGDASIAWFEGGRPDEMNLARMGGRPLHLVKTKGGSIIFTSAKENMDAALATFPQLEIDERWDMKEGEKLTILGGEVLEARDDWPVITASKYQSQGRTSHVPGGYGYGYDWDDDDRPRVTTTTTTIGKAPSQGSKSTSSGAVIGTRTRTSPPPAPGHRNPTIGELSRHRGDVLDEANAGRAARPFAPKRKADATIRQEYLWDYFFESFVEDKTDEALYEGLEFIYCHVSDAEMIHAERFVEELIEEELSEAFENVRDLWEFEDRAEDLSEDHPHGEVISSAEIKPRCTARGPLNQQCSHSKHSIELAHTWPTAEKHDPDTVNITEKVIEAVKEGRTMPTQRVYDTCLGRVRGKAMACLAICCDVQSYNAVKAVTVRLEKHPPMMLTELCRIEDSLIEVYAEQEKRFSDLGRHGKAVAERIAQDSEIPSTRPSTELVLANVDSTLTGEQKESD